MAPWVTEYILSVQGPIHVPRVSIVVQLNLVVCSILRAILCVLPFTMVIFIEICLVDVLVVAIGVCTTVICTLAYYSFITLIWCMRGIINGIGLREVVQYLIPGRQCGFCRYLYNLVVVFMIPASLLYTRWHFNFVRQTWLHDMFVVTRVLHILPTSLMILTTPAQGVFLVGIMIPANPLQSVAQAHGSKVRKHVRAFKGLNIALLIYSASVIFIACSQGVKIDGISLLVWPIEITFRLLSIATAMYVERSIGDEHQILLPPGRGKQADGEVDNREPLNGGEDDSDEAQGRRENVSLPSQPSGTEQQAEGKVEIRELLNGQEVINEAQDQRDNVSLPSQPSGTGQLGEREVEDHEPLNGEEVGSDEDEAQDQRENVSLPSQPPGTVEQAEGEVDDREPLNGEEDDSDEAQDPRENVSLPSQPSGTEQQAEGEVDDCELLNGDVASDEAPVVCLESQDQRENVHLTSQTPTEQSMLQAGQSMSSEPFIQFPNREYMELPIPTSRPVYIPFLSPYGEAFCIPGSLVAQETNRDSAPNELVALHC